MPQERSELGEGLYWMAEKLAWGYDDEAPNLPKAFQLFKQAAALGDSDAWIRVGELYEHGKGTERDIRKALEAYQSAARTGNFYALAFLAMLLSRGPALDKANELWLRFFKALKSSPEAEFKSSSRGELLCKYIQTQISLGLEPQHLKTLQTHRIEIVGHYQRVLEHPMGDEQLNRLKGLSMWIENNLGPWPINHTN